MEFRLDQVEGEFERRDPERDPLDDHAPGEQQCRRHLTALRSSLSQIGCDARARSHSKATIETASPNNKLTDTRASATKRLMKATAKAGPGLSAPAKNKVPDIPVPTIEL